jgi:hypothetical protein
VDTKTVGMSEAWRWFVGGWRLYKLAPWRWLIATLLWTIIAVGLVLLFSFAGAFLSILLFPIVYAGFLQGASELQRGGELTIRHVFRGVTTRSKILPLLFLGLLPIGFALASLTFVILLGGTFMPGLLVVTTLGIPTSIAFLYACPLVMFAGVGPIRAIKSSYDACAKNIGASFIVILALLFMAMATVFTFGLGLFLAMPVGFCALYLSYTSIYGQS